MRRSLFLLATGALCVAAIVGCGSGRGGKPDARGEPDARRESDARHEPDARRDDAGPDAGAPAPPPGALRRLNRVEYDNTLRDLLGITSSRLDRLPPDTSLAGFDTLSEGLSLSPALIEEYDLAAEQAADEVLAKGATPSAAPRVITCDPALGEACVRAIVQRLARRAWRRPVTDAEVERLTGFVAAARAQGDPLTVGLALAIRAILTSPHFLFLVELPARPAQTALSDHELAARLSYLLWSSMPDDALFAAADAGALGSTEQRRAQVRRMLADRRSDALITGYAYQWLDLGRLARHEINQLTANHQIPFVSLRGAYEQETRLFLREVLLGDAPLDRLLLGRFTYLNQGLADWYGIPTTRKLVDWERVEIPASVDRGGLLTHGSIMTLTSQYDRTSPVKRGVWILESLLCAPPPPPPPDVTAIAPPDPARPASVRQLLESHRANPTCAACHDAIDPLGFGLESYDFVGRHRTQDNGVPVDSAGKMPDGTRFTGAQELQRLLAASPRFHDCAAQKLLTYALGRDVADDRELVQRFGATLRTEKVWSRLLEAIVASPEFANHRPRKEGR